MSVLVPVTYYRIPRTDEDRREAAHDRAFELALRWSPLAAYHPDAGLDEELVEIGQRTLLRLQQGDEVSERLFTIAIQYLAAAIVFYDTATWEPYPGRNTEAVGNLRELAELMVLP